MKQIWAPWRLEYILKDKEKGCIFCRKPEQNEDDKNYILYRGKTCYVMMNLYPYTGGHLMVSPYKHAADTTKLSQDELTELMTVTNKSIKALKKLMSPDGFNVGINIGKAGGAGIEEHLHVHIVPRWAADTNFMPVLSDTRVIPEGLTETYDKLKPLFE